MQLKETFRKIRERVQPLILFIIKGGHALTNRIEGFFETIVSSIKARHAVRPKQQHVRIDPLVNEKRKPPIPEIDPELVKKIIVFASIFAGVFIIVLLFIIILWLSFFETGAVKLSLLGIDALWLMGIFLILQAIPFFSYSLFMKKERGDIVLLAINISHVLVSFVFLVWLCITLLFPAITFV